MDSPSTVATASRGMPPPLAAKATAATTSARPAAESTGTILSGRGSRESASRVRLTIVTMTNLSAMWNLWLPADLTADRGGAAMGRRLILRSSR